MRFLIGITVTFAFLGCNNNLSEAHKSDKCELYYDFIKSQWLEQDDYFQFRDEPLYLGQTKEAREIREKYFSEVCLIGLPKNKIYSLFGKPSKDISSEGSNINSYTYCLDDSCYKSLNFVLKDGIVIQVSPHPFDIVREH